MSVGRLIAIEGVSGVGKSSLAAIVADLLGGSVMRLPDSFRAARAAVSRDVDLPPSALLAYYLAGTMHLAARVELELRSVDVVCDRYIASVLGLAEASGGLTRDDIEDLVRPYLKRIPRAAITIVLEAEHDAVARRIGDRRREESANQEAHSQIRDDPDFAAAWGKAIREWSANLGPVLTLDTTLLQPESVLAKVMSAVEQAPESSLSDQ